MSIKGFERATYGLPHRGSTALMYDTSYQRIYNTRSACQGKFHGNEKSSATQLNISLPYNFFELNCGKLKIL